MSRTPALNHTQVFSLDPLPENLLRQPIDYLLADHHRQSKICKYLDELRDEPDSASARTSLRAVMDYLAVELPRHVADEEDLFETLSANCAPDDDAVRLIDRLRSEHSSNSFLFAAAEADLTDLESPGTSDQQGQAVADFTDAKRRHIQLENELLLPLARARLGADELKEMGRAMASRRGMRFPD